jgi:IstB-like ATP binding protein
MAGSLPKKGRTACQPGDCPCARAEVGLGLRQIARSCSIGLGTVHEYLQRAEAAGVTWPLGEDPTLADGILDRLVHNAHRIEMRGDSMRKESGQAKRITRR